MVEGIYEQSERRGVTVNVPELVHGTHAVEEFSGLCFGTAQFYHTVSDCHDL